MSRDREPGQDGSRCRWRLLSILLVASALILPGLSHKDLWIDEADSVYFAQHSWPALFSQLCDPHPPLYYALLKLTIASGGTSEFVTRLPSALAGILAVAALARLTRELRGGKIVAGDTPIPIWLPAALLALAPLHVWYAQEARMYAFVTLLGLGATIYAARLARRWNALDAAGYAAVAAAALLTDQSALLVLLPLTFMGALAARRSTARALGSWLVLQIVALLPFVLWWSRAETLGQVSAGTLYPLTMVRLTLERWGNAIRNNPWMATLGRPWGAAALGLAGAILVATVCIAAKRLRSTIRSANRQRRVVVETGAQVMAWVIVNLYALGTIVSVLPRLYTLKRLIVSLLPYALLIAAYALTRLRTRPHALAAVLAFSLGMSLMAVWAVRKDPWREVLTLVGQASEPADVVWVDDLAMPIYDYYSDTEAEPRAWRAENLGAIATTLPTEGKLWLIAQANRYRDLFDYYPALDEHATIWSGAWPGIEIRAYDLAQLDRGALSPQPDIPDWLRDWPSPLDEACYTP